MKIIGEGNFKTALWIWDTFHDRYLIIDGATLIHVGASLNCLGKRCFAFSTLDAEFIPDIMARVP